MTDLEVYTCHACSRVFTIKSVEQFKKHIEQCETKSLSCEICNKKFASVVTLNRHLKISHEEFVFYKCTTCGKKFTTKYSLRLHEARHFDDGNRQRISCDYCDKTFAWKSSLTRHLQNHVPSDVKAYFCPCGKRFRKYTSLYSHKRACPVFIETSDSNVQHVSRVSHVSTDTEEVQEEENKVEVHSCQQCGLKFYDRQQLSDHIDECNPFLDLDRSRSQLQYTINKQTGKNRTKVDKSTETVKQESSDLNEIVIEIHTVQTANNGQVSDDTDKVELPDNKLANTKEKSVDTKEKLADTKEKLADTKEKSADIKEKSADTKEKSADTKEKSTDTMEKLADTMEKSADTKEKSADTKKNHHRQNIYFIKRCRNPASVNEGNTLNPASVNEGNTLNPASVNEGNTLNPASINEGNTLNPASVNEGNILNPASVNEGNTQDFYILIVNEKENSIQNWTDNESTDTKESFHPASVKEEKICTQKFELEIGNAKENSSQNLNNFGRSKRKRKPKQFADFETDFNVSGNKQRPEKTAPVKKDARNQEGNKIKKIIKNCSPKTSKSSATIINNYIKENNDTGNTQVDRSSVECKKDLSEYENHMHLEPSGNQPPRSTYIILDRSVDTGQTSKRCSNDTCQVNKKCSNDTCQANKKCSNDTCQVNKKCSNDTCQVNKKCSNDTCQVNKKCSNDTCLANKKCSNDTCQTIEKCSQLTFEEDMDNENEDINDPDYLPPNRDQPSKMDGTEVDVEEESIIETENVREEKKKPVIKQTSTIHQINSNAIYICQTDKCCKQFSLRIRLLEHKREKHNEKLEFMCSICKKVFTKFCSLKSHLRMSHFKIDFVDLAFKNVEFKRRKDKNNAQSTVPLLICTKCGELVESGEPNIHSCSFLVYLHFFCPYCNCTEATYTGIQNHLQETHPNKEHTVTYGSKYVNLRNQALHQALLHITATTTTCGICKEEFSSHNDLQGHISKQHGCLPFCCGVCLQCYGRRGAIKRHMMGHSTGRHVCSMCEKSFHDKSLLESHERSHTGEKPYACDICKNRYHDGRTLRKHIQKQHPLEFKEIYKDSKAVQHLIPDSEGCICPICGQVFGNPSQLDKHIQNHDLQCPQCKKIFTKSYNLRHHMVVHKAGRAQLNKYEQTSQIVSINTNTEMKKLQIDLKQVDETHPSGKPYSCRVCKKRFRKVKFLNCHIQCMHLEDQAKNCVCHICKKGFPRFSSLKNHLRIHTNSRPYLCRLCPKTFRQLGHIKEHLRIHGKSLYECRYCSKSFKTESILKNHIIHHSTILPFKCPDQSCKQAFATVALLLHHITDCSTQEKADKVYLCHICNQTFQSSSDAVLHLYKHEFDELFPCDVCGNKMTSFKELYFHKVKYNHFNEKELKSNGAKKTFRANSSRTVSNVDLDMSLETLLSQYDYIDNDAAEIEENVQEDNAQNGEVVEEIYGNDEEELIVIAEQLTHMASGVDHFTETVIPRDECKKVLSAYENTHLEPSFTQPSIIPEHTLQYTELIEENTPSQNLGYQAIIVKDSSIQFDGLRTSNENLDTVDEINETISSTNELMKVDKPLSTNENLNGFDVLQDFESKIIEVTENISNNSSNTSLIPQSANSLGNANNDCQEAKVAVTQNDNKNQGIVFDENLALEDGLDYDALLMSLCGDTTLEHVKVVDTCGNLVTVYVVNDQDEQEQVTDIHEILKSVLATGKYKIKSSFKQMEIVGDDDNSLNSTFDTEKTGKVISNVRLVQVIVIAENEDIPQMKETIKTTENESKPRMKKKLESEKGRIRNVKKIRGEFVENDVKNIYPSEYNYKANLNCYEEKTASTHPFSCDQCDLRFVRIKGLNNHRKSHLPNDQKKYQCSTCSKGFNTPSMLKVHMRTHTGEKPFTCNICGAVFRQRGHLLIHSRGHLNYYPFKCTFCGKKYRANSMLTKHVKNHHPEPEEKREFSCELCPSKGYSSYRDLQCHKFFKHLKTELQNDFLNAHNSVNNDNSNNDNKNKTGDKGKIRYPKQQSYICDICGSQSKDSYSFKIHRQRHDSGTDFKCFQCGKGLPTEILLKEHIRVTHVNHYPCERCGDLIRERAMKQHLLKKHNIGQYKYKCQNCEAKFNIQHFFVKHMSSCRKNDFFQFINKQCNSQPIPS